MANISNKPIKIISILALFFLCSCSANSREAGNSRLRPGNIAVDVSDQFQPLTINNIAILPLTFSDEREEESSRMLDSNLSRILSNSTSFEVIAVDVPESKFGPEVIAGELAKAKDLQGVIFGTINRFQEKKENEYTEASVDISISLYDAAKQKVVWRANYRDKFEPLSDNIFQLPRAFKQKFKAPSSLELAIEGFKRIAKDLELRRNQALSSQAQ